MTAARIAKLTEGQLIGNPDAVILRGRADSRLCRKGDLYVALPGGRTHGSLFVASAWDAGATVALVDGREEVLDPSPEKALIRVEDSLAALQAIARKCRDEVGNLTVVGVTGSNGKTTTKDILAGILMDWVGDAVLATEGNYNSDIGLPLTMLNLREKHRFAVLEMGMNRVGEMALLADIAKPAVSIITNIGSAHVGMLGSRKAIAAEKRRILDGARPSSVALVAYDEAWGDFLTEGFPGEVKYFGEWGAHGWNSYTDLGLDGYEIIWKGHNIRFGIPGKHNLRNAMAAGEAATALGAPDESVVRGLESVVASSRRTQVLKGRITVINDCYNANLESMEKALELFGSVSVRGRRILVMGELLELGKDTDKALRQAGTAAVAAGPDEVYLFGDLQPVEAAMKAAGYNGDIHLLTDMNKLKKAISASLNTGDLVLLKGSRGSALERLEKTILERRK